MELNEGHLDAYQPDVGEEVEEMHRIIDIQGPRNSVRGEWLIGVVKGSLDEGYLMVTDLQLAGMEYNKDAKNPNGQVRFRFEILDLIFVSGKCNGRTTVWSAEKFRDLNAAKAKKAGCLDGFLRSIGAPGRDIRRGWTLVTEDRRLNFTRRELKKFTERGEGKRKASAKFMRPREDVPKERALIVRRRQDYPIAERSKSPPEFLRLR